MSILHGEFGLMEDSAKSVSLSCDFANYDL